MPLQHDGMMAYRGERVSLLIILFIAIMILEGCATTTDPRAGGLFSYNPSAYRERVKQREQTLSTMESDQQQQRDISRQLEEEARAKQAALAAQEQQLAALDEDTATIQQKIEAYREKTRAQGREKARLEQKLRLAKEQVKVLQARRQESSQDADAIAAKMQKLKQEIDELLHLTLRLTQGSKS